MIKIELLPKESIVRMNRFLFTYGFEVTGASITDSGTLNLGLTCDEVTGKVAQDLANFCLTELGLDVHRFMINSHHVVEC